MSGKAGLVTSNNWYLEHCFLGAEHIKNAVPDAGWPSVDKFTCAASGLDFYGHSFAREEAFRSTFHMAHGVDLTRPLHVDLHYLLTTADADGVAKMKLSLWLINIDGSQDLSALGAADDTYTWELTGPDDDGVPSSAMVMSALDLSAVAANKTVHSHIGYRIERLAAGDGDTHDGEVFVLRGELFLPMGTGEMIAGI